MSTGGSYLKVVTCSPLMLHLGLVQTNSRVLGLVQTDSMVLGIVQTDSMVQHVAAGFQANAKLASRPSGCRGTTAGWTAAVH